MAGTSLATAYVQIVPSAQGIKGKLSNLFGNESKEAGEESGEKLSGGLISKMTSSLKGKISKLLGKETEEDAEKNGENAGNQLGNGFVSKLKGVIAAAGIGKIIKDSLDAGGNLQQSFGGLETIYGEAADQAKEFASVAASAGISANSYAEQAVSFGAALKQAYGGDLTSAAKAANVAIMDMADNSAKMGTDMASIQNAYQGFAKQNYTMLDNLKLGYGGTKSEMERLLADAEKLSGVHYDISNLGDVYNAIHVIQENLGLTGVAAEEARHTFTGSFGAMKAAVENVAASLTSGVMDVTPQLQQLAQSVSDFLFLNLIPMLGRFITGLPSALATFVESAIPALIEGAQTMISTFANGMSFSEVLNRITNVILEALQYVENSFPQVMQEGVETVTQFANGLFNNMPEVISKVGTIIQNGLKVITEAMPTILDAGFQLIGNLATGILNNMPLVIENIATILRNFLQQITENLPEILESGITMIEQLADGILNNMPAVIESIGSIMSSFISFIMQNLPTILEKGVELIAYLAKGIIQNMPEIISAIANVLAKLLATIAQNMPQFLQKGIELLGKIGSGIIQAVPKIIGSIPGILKRIASAFMQYDWLSIGRNIISGIANGITNAVGNLVGAAVGAAKRLVSGVKGFFQIGSPSKLMNREIGRQIPAGTAEGIIDNAGTVTEAMNDINHEIANAAPVQLPVSSIDTGSLLKGQVSGVYDKVGSYGTVSNSRSQSEYAGDISDGLLNVTININGYDKDKRELAEEIEEIINRNISRRRAVFE